MNHVTNEKLTAMRELHQRAEAAWCTVEGGNGRVRLSVGQAGELTELWLHPDVSRLEAHEITDLIMDNYRLATERMRAKVLERFKAVYGVAWTMSDLIRGDVDPARLLESLSKTPMENERPSRR